MGRLLYFAAVVYIFFLSSFFFFLAYSQRTEVGCLRYFHTWCGLTANLQCMSEMCRTLLCEKIGLKKSPNEHHRTSLSGCIFVTKAYIDNQKKIRKQQYLLHTNFCPLTAEIVSGICGTPSNFNGFRVLLSLLQRRRSTEANQALHDVWPSPGLIRYIYIFRDFCLPTEFCPVQYSL